MLRLMRTSIPVLTVLAVAGLAGRAEAQGQQRPHPQPPRFTQLHAALHELREAKRELEQARSNFGGHRDAALAAVRDGVASLELLLNIRSGDIRGYNRDPDYYKRYPNFPRMRQALHDLREARDELRQSWEEHGALRERALRDISNAIQHVQAALQSAGPMPGGNVKYPCMHFALHELREARQELATARDDFGPRKETAQRAINDAIASLETILRVKGDSLRGFDRDRDFYRHYGNYPRLRQTVHDLREARDELRECGEDFAGLKGRALHNISVAIDSIQAMVPPRRVDR